MVAFVGSLLLTFVMVGLILVFAKLRPAGTPLSWGEAMVAATFVFFLMFWAYGVVPHQWLIWADNELKWRPDKYLVGWGGVLGKIGHGGYLPLTITYQAIRDIIAVLIYVVLLGGQMALWSMWQSRGKKAAAKAAEVDTTAFGRPLVKNG